MTTIDTTIPTQAPGGAPGIETGKVGERPAFGLIAEFETPGACTAEDARLAQLEVESCAADVEE